MIDFFKGLRRRTMGMPRHIMADTGAAAAGPPPFKYRQLGRGEIRVLELEPGTGQEQQIRGSLRIISVTPSTAAVERYSALSYTWGLDAQKKHPLLLDGQQFPARESLHQALVALRHKDVARRLWIDAICINQPDEEEKGNQLRLMSMIYSKAETVEIWLGLAGDDSDIALRAISGEKFPVRDAGTVLTALDALVRRSWFTRLWIIQEVVLAAPGAAFLNCGPVRTDWDSFAEGIGRLVGNLDSVFGDADQTAASPSSQVQLAVPRNKLSLTMNSFGMNISGLCDARMMRLARSKPSATAGAATAVGLCLRSSRYAQATMARDKVYGLCGLYDDAGAVDALMEAYCKPIEEVYFAATLCILQRDRMPNLYHSFPTLPLPRCKSSGVPSWTLDLSFSGTGYAETMFEWWGLHSAARTGGEKLSFAGDDSGKKLATDACLIGKIAKILHYPVRKAQAPETAEDWKQFWVRFRGHASALALDVLKRLEAHGQSLYFVGLLANSINFVAFLLEAESMREQAAAAAELAQRKGPDITTTISSLYEIITAGQSDRGGLRGAISSPAVTSRLDREMNMILGHSDHDFPKTDFVEFWEAAALALGLDDRHSRLAMERRTAAHAVTLILQGVLEPRLSSIRTSFFATESGLCGISLPGAQVGDAVAMVFRGSSFEMPAVLREEEQIDSMNKPMHYSLVCVANVPDEWIRLRDHAVRNTSDPEEVILV
ncbi:heterokaryon incompatibility protein-domain-containing protein [Lasiosphaeria ovina]|uniref:Heterokaryon incompatibility protein-domain-containing protein n=1 Tax=Lasiosphaeria ovina TaxID=92902 RepID=A0AAE0KHU2_9PEZI|nr:heterokaryon incompatibility protein-domain-containing protein [Lasiosphaeria ovina]